MINDQILDFVQSFSENLDAQKASDAAGLSISSVAEEFCHDEDAKELLKSEMQRKIALYESIPASIIRVELIKVFMAADTPAAVKVQAGKLLVELMTGNTDANKNIADLIHAITSNEPYDPPG